ncbi:low-affinity phosphate transporter [Apophysomyces sp. BC1034]|nr:low-affinity phosphate transporter [Apophysomyces sp. BC1015]KAG0180426.1 low-affinity phosphate transporter [Apophysomyces sp. BC1021]KAG0190994.1 low-affinity phosphate transporter [Apophysomyces sp. BC1034]
MALDLERSRDQSSEKELKPDLFLNAVSWQLKKISDFYLSKEMEIRDDFNKLDSAVADYANTWDKESFQQSLCTLDSHDPGSQAADSPRSVERRVDLRCQFIHLCASLYRLVSYTELNRMAFENIINSTNSIFNSNLPRLQKIVHQSYAFLPQTSQDLRDRIERIESLFADMFCNQDRAMAVRQIRAFLPLQFVQEQNDMGLEGIKVERMSGHMTGFHVSAKQGCNIGFFVLSVIVFAVLLNVNSFGELHENRCFALLVLVSLLWASEAIPLYATSLLVPFLIVLLDVLRYPGGQQMDPVSAAKVVFESMFSGTIMMLLGGFALATALSKYGIAKAFASYVLSRAGSRPRWTLLSIMFISSFLSMWISNVATPVLCFSLIDPILRTLPHNSRVAPCLILGIALASCIGGMTSPISSPQNIITLYNMDPKPGWGVWFAAALPVAIFSDFAAWIILLLVYKPDRDRLQLQKISTNYGNPSATQVCVTLTTLATIALWCAEGAMQNTVGDMGIVAIIPLFVFFGLGILDKNDIHSFLWTVVLLAQGGLALGNAVNSSGLLQDIAIRISHIMVDLDPMTVLAIFTLLILVMSTFVSHTVAALIIIPVVKEVGQNLPDPHPNLLVMGAGLACSVGMGLPVSGYPNMSAIMLERPDGKRYLTIKDFFFTGIPTSIICAGLIVTLGYGILWRIGY